MNLKRLLMFFGILGVISCIGCSQKPISEQKDYSLCNVSSVYKMAEVENGFFYAFDGILYYMEKETMNDWVPVCNKPDCTHEMMKLQCNAYLPSYNQIVQKNGTIYGVEYGLGKASIYEIALDGSGLHSVYDIPLEVEDNSPISGFSSIISENQLIVAYMYLNEQGIDKGNLACLKDQELTLLYTQDSSISIQSAKLVYGIRGDDTYILNLPNKEGTNLYESIWKIDENGFGEIDFPEYINFSEILGAYLSGETFTYYVANEGFYQCDLSSGEKTLISENHLEDSRGYVLTEEYMVEFNRYVDYTPEEAFLKFYNGKEWIDVILPDEVSNSDSTFYPVCVASDKIFFGQTINGIPHLYYFMIDAKNPELIATGAVRGDSEDVENQLPEIETDIEGVTVFDNEYCILKMTGTHTDNGNYYIDYYWESKKEDYYLSLDAAVINGIECNPNQLFWKEPDKNEYTIQFSDSTLKENGVSDIYEPNAYTDIELHFSLSTSIAGSNIENKIIHIYPQGEEKVEKYIRETNTTDVVLIDNEKVKVTAIDYEQNTIPNDCVKVLIENKTGKKILVGFDAVSINGLRPWDHVGGDFFSQCYISAGACAFQTLNCFDSSFLDEYGITNVGKIELLVKAFYHDKENGTHLEKAFISENVALYPSGEEAVESYEYELQPTDIVLIDNEYVTLIMRGYEDFSYMRYTITNGIMNMYLINKTNQTLCLKIGDALANGLMITNAVKEEYVLPQNSIAYKKYLDISSFKELGITKITDMEFVFSVFADENIEEAVMSERIQLYPEGEEHAKQFVRESELTDKVLIDNAYITLIFTGYEDVNDIVNGKAKFYITNKTDQDIKFQLDGISVNGMENEEFQEEESCIFAGASTFHEILPYVYEDTEMKFIEIDSLEFVFQADLLRKDGNAELANEKIVLSSILE